MTGTVFSVKLATYAVPAAGSIAIASSTQAV
jgi:hypothetical protein